MPTIEFEVTVASPLAAVWAFFEDVPTSLPALTSAEEGLIVDASDLPVRVGSRIVLGMNGPLGRVRWVARIVEHVPPHPVVFGEEARFVDEQEEGPFKHWRHAHEFEAQGDKTTRVLDRITYRVPLGPIGWIADRVYVRRKLAAAFAHRHDQLRKRFGDPG
jgi:ligand-binding SRPBCC domain-containing protein